MLQKTFNISHFERRQHPSPFAESNEKILLLNNQDIDNVVEGSLDEEGEEMVADDVKKGSMPIRLVNQAKAEEQKFIEVMKLLDVVD